MFLNVSDLAMIPAVMYAMPDKIINLNVIVVRMTYYISKINKTNLECTYVYTITDNHDIHIAIRRPCQQIHSCT